ncbi:hypothetical protein [Intestinirhabdus alba]|jgi:hypothetical protein|uniref:Uncharacterized protein n=1 Tax=Intestinirhabdus alba TaxID=2899544 RepID=A0A6L6IKP5_9ENTR|nr:hypothetical protein [Intestinirhabdus alba]MTH47431.1 hypothetical protein [Intestinirhabdus alba]
MIASDKPAPPVTALKDEPNAPRAYHREMINLFYIHGIQFYLSPAPKKQMVICLKNKYIGIALNTLSYSPTHLSLIFIL